MFVVPDQQLVAGEALAAPLHVVLFHAVTRLQCALRWTSILVTDSDTVLQAWSPAPPDAIGGVSTVAEHRCMELAR